MRTPNDIQLAEGVEDIDLILGGHDHVYEVCQVSAEIPTEIKKKMCENCMTDVVLQTLVINTIRPSKLSNAEHG
jgi:2',3'-cyclic-nucleotide 2'-phosphodiesterase (5'-nucleotidase family)